MKRKDLYMGTTQISASRTISEIQEYLVRLGANQIVTQFKDGEVTGLYFTMLIKGSLIPFQLPARVEPVYKILNAGRIGSRARDMDMDQAKRVAWRQVYRWIQAQLSMVETGMVEAGEVLMPYMQTGPNETLYQKAVSGGFQRLLSAPSAQEHV